MTSTHDHAPHGHDENCVVCTNKIETMAFRGTGVCGDICLTQWRKDHPLPEELRVSFEDFAKAVHPFATEGQAQEVWNVLNGTA